MNDSNLKTTAELTALLTHTYETVDEEVDETTLRYAIYARKSTDESSDKQVRSLGDQIAECQALAEREGLNVVEIFSESESAKAPDIRQEFRAMLDGLNAGKYDGIITWHPDRLSRNMKEAGEVIDMVDKRVIHSLKFVSFNFTNDTSGKMLLGITFVLSKQYSDQLSQNVKRGIRKSIEEGKYLSKGKFGYTKDKNQYLRPDEEVYQLIKEAWEKRLDGMAIEDVAKWLNQQGASYKNKVGVSRVELKATKQKMSDMFKDSTYAGVLVYGSDNQVINLTEVYDFIPMISVEMFCKINNLTEEGLKKNLIKRRQTEGKKRKAHLLNGVVICNKTQESLVCSITSKKLVDGTKRLYYYFKYEHECEDYGKSIRAKEIIKYASDFLKQYDFATKEMYEYFVEEKEALHAQQTREIDRALRSLRTKHTGKEKAIGNVKKLLGEAQGSLKQEYETDLEKLLEERGTLEKAIEHEKERKENLSASIISCEELLELLRKVTSGLDKVQDMAKLDTILQNIFSNFYVEDKKVVGHTLKTPFKEYFEEHFGNCPKW